MPAMNTLDEGFEDGIATLKAAQKDNHDRLHFGLCKVMTDGSIQGFTGRLKWLIIMRTERAVEYAARTACRASYGLSQGRYASAYPHQWR